MDCHKDEPNHMQPPLLFIINLSSQNIPQMKKSLAHPRRDNKPTGGANSLGKKISVKISEQRGTSNQKPTQQTLQVETHNRGISQKFEQRFRNKNLKTLPTQMLVTFSGLTTLDLSYNKLTDSQIQLIMNSCNKLTTFCMQGNLTLLIPAQIQKLKNLVNFRHDWIKLNNQDMYEPQQRLEKIKQIVKKPQIVNKINKIVGLDFFGYCRYVLQISIDKNLVNRIQKCDCSNFARDNMLKITDQLGKGIIKKKQKLVTINQAEQKFLLSGCFGAFKFEDPNKAKIRQQKKWNSTLSQAETEQFSPNIKIEDIRDITNRQAKYIFKSYINNNQLQIYNSPGFPLHQILANFDKNPHGSSQIDGLLLKGYNPNQYDSNGLSPYHLCIIRRQKKGLDYLLEISANNPGFFDLQMPSVKQGRNLLHFCVFLKNFHFAKALIQFGLPLNKRDASGARIQHLVDQNYEFLLLLRKLLKKRTFIARNLSALSIPQIPHQNKKNYTKHPQRQKQQSRFNTTYSKNEKLLEMYQAAAEIPLGKV